MGIYDREYYRDESSSFLGTLARRGSAWRWLVTLNVVAFVLQLATAERGVNGWVTHLFDLNTDAVLHGQVWRLLTYAFLHSEAWQHIVFNMLIVWWAGSELEDIYGSREFLAFYLLAAFLGGVAYVGWQLVALPREGLPREAWPAAIGASGAGTAVLMLFAMHYPTRTIYVFFVIPVPVILLVALNVLMDTVGLMGGIARPIAFAVHLGGAAFGFLYYKFQWRVLYLWPTGWHLPLRRARPKLRVYRGEPERVRVPVDDPPPVSDSQLDAEVDAVLDKVARHGKSSLTEREQQVLLRASEIYRQRRK